MIILYDPLFWFAISAIAFTLSNLSYKKKSK